MFFKRILRKLWERLTGRRCHRCKYNRAGHCTHPSEGMFMRCWHSVTRPGWTGKYEKAPAPKDPAELGKRLCEGFEDGMRHTRDRNRQRESELTQEEKYQLQKIRDALEEAEDMARESGLLSED